MKIGIIISTTDPEKVWNALRFVNTAILEKHQAKIFLLGQGVEIENIKSEKLNVSNQLDKLKQLGIRNIHITNSISRYITTII